MMPAGDNTSRSLLLRRVSSWSQVTCNAQSHDVNPSTSGAASDDSFSLGSTAGDLSQHPQEDELSSHVMLLPELEYELPERRPFDDEAAHLIDAQAVQRQPCRRLTSLWKKSKKVKLGLVFMVLVLSGVCNVILAKLQSVPMYNYPTFLNLYANFMYIPISFAYIIPTTFFGWFQKSIPRSHWKISKTPFLIMGALDSISAAMQVLSSVYLPGTLLVLLPQAAIPFSIVASKAILKEQFTRIQYVGAMVVLFGIIVVLFPVILTYRSSFRNSTTTHVDEDEELDERQNRQDNFLVFFWSLVMLASCVPMTFSSIYKQVALTTITQRHHSAAATTDTADGLHARSNQTTYVDTEVHMEGDLRQPLLSSSSASAPILSDSAQPSEPSTLDPIFVNGWVSIFQFLFAVPLAIPAGLVSSPPVAPWDLPANWYHAMKCMFQHVNSVLLEDTISSVEDIDEAVSTSVSPTSLFYYFIQGGTQDYRHADDCHRAVLWVHLGLLSGITYTISIICMLKYGSSALLYMALTVMVPLGHLVFAMHSPASIQVSDVAGLCVLLLGLVLYRFGHDDDDDEDEDGNQIGNGDDNNGEEEAYLDQNESMMLPTITLSSDTNEPSTTIIVDGMENVTRRIRNRHGANRSSQAEDYWEFLREPFMLSGDI